MRKALFLCLMVSLQSFTLAVTKAENATGQLLADTNALVGGKPFMVGVLFRIVPSWHVYWINPGDSGLATSVKFEAPSGYTVSEVQFPVPTKFLQPGELIAYGYAEQVMLMATVTPPKDLFDQKVTIKASGEWLVCSDVCVPGRGKWELTLPVASSSEPANAEVFNVWKPQVPVDAKSAESPGEVTTHGALSEGSKSATFTIQIKWKHDTAADVEFFPGKSRALRLHDITVQTSGKVTTVSLVADRLGGQQLEMDRLSCVAAFSDSQGNRRGIRIELPLKERK